jgi:uncharacterized protein YcfJ
MAMKTLALASTLSLAAFATAGPSLAQSAQAMELGTVLSVTPVVQQVPVAHRVCDDEPVAVQGQPSGAGALIGAIAGGAMGNAVGAGAGRAAATAIGLIGGAAVGNSIESGGRAGQAQGQRRCTAQSSVEARTVAYSVVYEYAGREYTTQMRRDPGRYVQVQVQAMPEGDVAPSRQAPPPRTRSAPQGSSLPPPVFVDRPGYPAYPAYPDAVLRSQPVQEPLYYEPAYPQAAPFVGGLVLGALIGYGAHHGGYRYHGRPWRGR